MYRMVLTSLLCGLTEVAIVIFFVSCTSYRWFEVEVLRPADIQVKSGEKVALLDRGIRRNNSSIFFEDKEAEADLITEMQRGINNVFVDMAYDTLAAFVKKEDINIEEDTIPGPLSPDSVADWCRILKTDYIISLEVIGYDLLQEEMNCSLRVGLYKSGEALPLDIFNLKSALREKFSYYREWNNKWLLEDIADAYWQAGASYARRIVPHWERTERRVYVSGRALGVGDILWQSGHKEEAMEIWEGLARLADKKAVKACINLAWAYEDSGNFDTSLLYLQRAEDLICRKGWSGMLSDYTDEYLKIIQLRIKQRDKLDIQLDSFE